MKYRIFDLQSMISKWDEKKIKSLLSSFKCSLNPDAEDFLKKSSVKHEKRGISRTYLVIQNDDSERGYSLAGYYTLAVKCFLVGNEHKISNSVLDSLNVNRGVAQSYLLGQVAKADGTEKGLGREMMDHALLAFSNGNKMFGCRTIRLDCKNEPRLVEYYQSCGFVSIGKNHDNALNQMVAIM